MGPQRRRPEGAPLGRQGNNPTKREWALGERVRGQRISMNFSFIFLLHSFKLLEDSTLSILAFIVCLRN